MDLEDYNFLIDFTDSIRTAKNNDVVDLIYNTIELSQIALEEFCKANLDGYNSSGKVKINVFINDDGEYENDINIYLNGKEMTDEELEPYAGEISRILSEVNDKVGWNKNDE